MLEIYSQMVHNTLGIPSLLLGSQDSNCCGQDLESDPNGALTTFKCAAINQPGAKHPLKLSEDPVPGGLFPD